MDEPSIGLHPSNIEGLNAVRHDLDVIRNADYVIDMGPGGGEAGGRIVAAGTPEQVADNKESLTGKYIKTFTE